MPVNLDPEDQGNLIGNTLIAEAGVPSLHLYDYRNQFSGRSLGPWLATRFGCEEQTIFPFDQLCLPKTLSEREIEGIVAQ